MTIASNVQLKEALRLHAAMKTAVAGQPLALGKASAAPTPTVMSVPLTQVPPEGPSSTLGSSTASGQLVPCKRRHLGKFLMPRSFILS